MTNIVPMPKRDSTKDEMVAQLRELADLVESRDDEFVGMGAVVFYTDESKWHGSLVRYHTPYPHAIFAQAVAAEIHKHHMAEAEVVD